MQGFLNREAALSYALKNGNILSGFTLDADHSILLCERGKEYAYASQRMRRASKEKPGERGQSGRRV